ncbi:epithelial cell transforming sequence 2 oncogene-like protein [Camelus ferus]|nr:epithelial cell transforming sequence 2 oncogene-like protein [Camelus ferus]
MTKSRGTSSSGEGGVGRCSTGALSVVHRRAGFYGDEPLQALPPPQAAAGGPAFCVPKSKHPFGAGSLHQLSEDCLWMPKCIKFGWFLPYTPTENEYGAWKHHYIACVSNLDWLTPREAAAMYGTLNEPKTEDEELQERQREKCLRKIIWEKIALRKNLAGSSMESTAEPAAVCFSELLFNVRPPWVSGTRCSRLLKSKCQPCLSQTMRDRVGFHETLEKQLILASLDALPKRSSVPGCHSYPFLPKKNWRGIYESDVSSSNALQPHFILISSRIPAYEMVVNSVKAGIVSVVYEHSGLTLESLFYLIEKALDGQKAQSVGIFSDGDSREINLIQVYLCLERVAFHIQFYIASKKLGCKIPGLDWPSSSDDILNLTAQCPINPEREEPVATVGVRGYKIGVKNLLRPEVRDFWEKLGSCVAPEDEGGHVDIFAPLGASVGQGAPFHLLQRIKAADMVQPHRLPGRHLEISKETIKSSLQGAAEECQWEDDRAYGLIFTGQFVFDTMSMANTLNNQEIVQALADGLTELSKENSEKKLQLDSAEKRTSVLRELFQSERKYVQILEIVRGIYVAPLRAALSSNRAILSAANIQIIFSDILQILYLNRQFLDALRDRLQEWGPAHCVGEIVLKFGSQLNTYTSFFNNYPVVLKTIEKCREMTPAFRAFLKRHDKTMVTHMLRLYEHIRDLSLFLFNDALLVSSRGTSHTPFERTSISTYQFIASVALHRLLIEDIPDSKCMYSFPPKS